MLSLIALPLIVANVREGLQAIPGHVREASYAVGKTQGRDDAAGAAAGGAAVGRDRRDARRRAVIGDTAIIVSCSARRCASPRRRRRCPFGTLQGTGSTLTSFVYENAPTGEVNQPEKAYAAAFVLLLMVLVLNVAVDVVPAAHEGRSMELIGDVSSLGGRTPKLRPSGGCRRRCGGYRWRTCRPPGRRRPPPAPTVAPRRERASSAPRRSIGAPRSRSTACRSTTSRSPTVQARPSKAVSLPIRQGEVLALIGPSGCGKTTLLRSLNRLTELTSTASLQRPDHARRRRHRDARADRAAAPRDDGLPAAEPVPDERVRQRRLRAARAGVAAPAQGGARGPVRSALERAGLYDEVADDLDHPALRLSGGQQQRLCIARALAAEPEVLLLDEPCSALDPQSTQVIEDLIVKLREEVAVVIVTHNLQQAYRIADHVAFMYLGELVEYGSAPRLRLAARGAHEGVRQWRVRLALTSHGLGFSPSVGCCSSAPWRAARRPRKRRPSSRRSPSASSKPASSGRNSDRSRMTTEARSDEDPDRA